MVETSTLVDMERGEHNSPNRGGIKPPKPGKHVPSIPTVSENVSFYNWEKCSDEESGSQNVPHI